MVSVERVDKERRGARGSERSGNLRTNVATLSYACDNDFAVAVVHERHGFLKVLIKLWYEVEYGLSFIAKTLLAISV